MEDISAMLREVSPSFAKLSQYLQKSNVVLEACRKIRVTSGTTDGLLKTSPMDKARESRMSLGPTGPNWVFDLDQRPRSVDWNTQDTLSLRKYLIQRGIPITTCVRAADLRLKPPLCGSGDRSTYFGTVLEIELGYHSGNQSVVLLFSRSNLLREGRWVELAARYLLAQFSENPIEMMWRDPVNPNRIEFKKVR